MENGLGIKEAVYLDEIFADYPRLF